MKDFGVLLVHDDDEILLVIKRMISYFKIRIDFATSAPEAFDLLKTKEYRTMISDLDLSGMNGIELASKAQKMFPDLNVILFFGKTPEQIIHLAIDPKVSDISGEGLKPCAFNEMLQDIMNKEGGKVFLLE